MADEVTADSMSVVAAKKSTRGARRPRAGMPSADRASPVAAADDATADLPVDTAAGQPTPPIELTADPAIDVSPAPVAAVEVQPAVSEEHAPVAEAPAPLSEQVAAPAPETATAFVAPIPAAKDHPMTDTATAFAAKAQDEARTAFNKVGEQTRTAVEKSRKVAEDMADFGKGNMEALVEASRIAAQGFEALGHDFAAFARERYDSAAVAAQSMASVKSPTELAQLQAEFFRGAFDALVKETSRSTEATLKLAGDVAKPLQNRFAIAADKFKVAA